MDETLGRSAVRTTRGLGLLHPYAENRVWSMAKYRCIYIANLSTVVENERSDQLKFNGKIHLWNCMWVVTEDEKM